MGASRWKRCVTWILDLLFPRYCVGCRKGGSYLCTHCTEALPLLGTFTLPHTSIDEIFALAHYDKTMQKAIHRIKYRGEFAILFDLIPLLVKQLPKSYTRADCVIPVPLHRKKERQRGFNQSEILARALATKLQLPFSAALLRNRPTTSQAQLKRKERLSNLKGAFTLRQPCTGKTILLVDDVATTGTTLNECAKVLKQHGAKKVLGVVLAHGT